jgi:hypothetical protein
LIRSLAQGQFFEASAVDLGGKNDAGAGRASGSSPEIELFADKMVKIECWTAPEGYGKHSGPFPKNGSEAGHLSVG